LGGWIFPRALELTYTAWDLEPFAKDCGYDGPPFRWDEERRFLLRCELDAAYFHLYGIARDDVDYIMDTFRVWREKEVKLCGDYRTKRVILEIYDELQRAIESGEPIGRGWTLRLQMLRWRMLGGVGLRCRSAMWSYRLLGLTLRELFASLGLHFMDKGTELTTITEEFDKCGSVPPALKSSDIRDIRDIDGLKPLEKTVYAMSQQWGV